MILYLDDEVPGVRPGQNRDTSITICPTPTLTNSWRRRPGYRCYRRSRRSAADWQRALALSVTAIFPALYADGGGEVVVQLDPRSPCFFCWDGFQALMMSSYVA